MKHASLYLLALLCLSSAFAQGEDDTGLSGGAEFDPATIQALDTTFTDFMTAHHPLGQTPAAAGNFLGGGLGHAFMAAAVLGFGDRVDADFQSDVGKAVVLNTVLTSGLKQLVGRDRPDHSKPTSWPSGHTSSTVAILTVLDSHLDGGFAGRAPLLILGATVALSRVQHRRHWLSDTLAGAALGYCAGRVACGEEDAADLAKVATALLAAGYLIRREQTPPPSPGTPAVAPAPSRPSRRPGEPRLTLWRTDF